MMMFLHSAATGAVAVVAALAGFLDPAWAPAANTALIVVLALISWWTKREAHDAKRQARDAKRAAGAVRRDDPNAHDTGDRRRWTDTPTGDTEQ